MLLCLVFDLVDILSSQTGESPLSLQVSLRLSRMPVPLAMPLKQDFFAISILNFDLSRLKIQMSHLTIQGVMLKCSHHLMLKT